MLVESAAAAGPCEPPVNEIVCENSKTGNPPTEWDVEGAGDPTIQGYPTEISVDRGQTIHFKIKTDASAYHLDIYRMGYYGGEGARKVASNILPSAKLPQSQPACLTEGSTGLIDCGNWSESASWTVPSNAVSGIYFAKLVRTDKTSEGSHIVFVVRNDESHSDLFFETADTTWEAYNRYGGNSLYVGGPGTDPDRAYKVSYNRPMTTRGTTPEDAPFSTEYPMVRWLERNGYEVSYTSEIDTARSASRLMQHKVLLSVGHDEYWSASQREHVEEAREAGVDLAFLSGNEVFWKTRWGSSLDSSHTSYRTIVCYKETSADAKIDPEPNVWTGTWRDPRFSPPADGGKPENSLTGQAFMVNSGTASIEVPADDAKMRLWRNTDIASLKSGETATLGTETLGYEWDEDLHNSSRPPGLVDLSSTTVDVQDYLIDYGSNYLPETAHHHLTLYRAPSGALVFGAGTVQWSWGLDEEHDRGAYPRSPDSRMQQATVNLFADMGTQPSTLQAGLVAATESTDSTPPTTTIDNPPDGSEVESGQEVTITGTATDSGGQVAGVEVSTDGGESWHPAEGRASWTYQWTPGAMGDVTIMARSTDDSANLEEPGAESTVEVVPHACPCSIWDASFTGEPETDPSQIEVGVKFRADTPGFITGLRFYKTPEGTGAHIGHLYTAGGTQLAEAKFTGETASGWQQVNLSSPVPISASTTYVASYYAPNGHYAALSGYFSVVGVDASPLHALADGVDGHNGVYKYGVNGSLFSGAGPESFGATNYLADVVFEAEEEPPVISTVNAAAHNDGTATVTWQTDKSSDSKVEYGTSPSSLGSSESSATQVTSHSVQLSGLNPDATYYFRVTSASGAESRTEPGPLESPLSFVTPPAPPTLTSSVPASPANENAPKLVGTAAVGSTVRFYATSGCTGSPLATASAAELAAGVSVSVADNSSTTFRATATGVASEASACSAGLLYVEDSTAPQTQVVSGPSPLSPSDAAKLEFSGSDPGGSGVASYQCRIDSAEAAAWASCTSPKTYASLTDGSHKFEVRAVDQAGNADASPASFEWTVDTTAPQTQIDSHPQLLSGSATAKLEFSGSDPGGSGVASYQCRLDSAEAAAWASCTSPKTYSSLADGSHKFEVRAVDQAGNADASPAVFEWTVDTTAPQTQIDSGPAALSSSAQATFAFSGSDPGGSGVTSYQCRRDSEAPGRGDPAAHPKPITPWRRAPTGSKSARSTRRQCRRIAGRLRMDDRHHCAADPDRLGPADADEFGRGRIQLLRLRRGRLGCGGLRMSPRLRRSGRLERLLLAAGIQRPDRRLSQVRSAGGRSGGQCRWIAVGLDLDGRRDRPRHCDRLPPEPSEPLGHRQTRILRLRHRLRRGGLRMPPRLGPSRGLVACASPKTYASPGDGSHKFEVRAVDQAGNLDASPASFEWSVHTTAPQTQINAHPNALSASAAVKLAVSGSDAGGSGVAFYQSRLDSAEAAAWASCTSPKTYSSLADGSHKSKSAVHQAGNLYAEPVRRASSRMECSTRPRRRPRSTPTRTPSAPRRRSISTFLRLRRRRLRRGLLPVPHHGLGRSGGLGLLHLAEDLHLCSPTAPRANSKSAWFTRRATSTRVRRASSGPLTRPRRRPRSTRARRRRRVRSRPNSASPAPTRMAPAWRKANVASTPPKRATVKPAFRRRPTPRSPTAPTSSKSERSTRRATSTRARRASNGPLTPRPRTPISNSSRIGHRTALKTGAQFRFSGSDTNGSGVALYECRIDSTEAGDWKACTSPKDLLLAHRRLPQVRSPRDRPGRQPRREPGELRMDASTPRRRRHQIDSNPTALSRLGHGRARILGLRRRRLRRGLLRMSPGLDRSGATGTPAHRRRNTRASLTEATNSK